MTRPRYCKTCGVKCLGAGRCGPCKKAYERLSAGDHGQSARLMRAMPGRAERVAALADRAAARSPLWAAGLPEIGG